MEGAPAHARARPGQRPGPGAAGHRRRPPRPSRPRRRARTAAGAPCHRRPSPPPCPSPRLHAARELLMGAGALSYAAPPPRHQCRGGPQAQLIPRRCLASASHARRSELPRNRRPTAAQSQGLTLRGRLGAEARPRIPAGFIAWKIIGRLAGSGARRSDGLSAGVLCRPAGGLPEHLSTR